MKVRAQWQQTGQRLQKEKPELRVPVRVESRFNALARGKQRVTRDESDVSDHVCTNSVTNHHSMNLEESQRIRQGEREGMKKLAVKSGNPRKKQG